MLASAATACSQPAPDDSIHLYPLEGEVFVEAEASWDREADSETIQEQDLTEGVTVRQRGDILDPRIADFSLEVQPTFEQTFLDDESGRNSSNTLELGYAGRLNLLQGPSFPLSLNLDASRQTGDTDGLLGSRSEFEAETRNAAVNWKTIYFPTTLQYSERLRKTTFRSGADRPTVTQRDDILRRLALRGRSSKLSLSAERDWFTDEIDGRDGDYNETRARASHSLTWGRNSRLDSSADFRDREGFNDNRLIRASEQARIQHTENLYSTTRYRFESFEQETDSIIHDAGLSLTHQLYENLTSTVGGSVQLLDSDVEEEEEYEGVADFRYRKDVFQDVTLTAGIGGAYGMTDRSAKDGRQSVVDESQAIGATGSVTLNQRLIDSETVIVTDPAGLIVFVEGADYELFTVGNDLTELRIILGGGINIGDPVLVSYRFDTLPDQRFETKELHYDVRLDFGWIALFHSQSFFEQDLIEGNGESLLIDREDMNTGVELTWNSDPIRATASAARRFTSDRDVEIETFQFQQNLGYRISPRANLNASASQVFSQENDPDRDVEVFTAGLSLQLGPWQNLTVNSTLDGLIRKERGDFVTEGDREELFLRGALGVRWSWRKVNLNLRYTHLTRRGDITDRDEDQVFLRVSRQF